MKKQETENRDRERGHRAALRARGASQANSEQGLDEIRWRAAMAATQAGDAAAYRALLAELVTVVERMTRARLQDAALAEDVAQNALLSLHRARHSYRPERPFGPWLRAIVRNACIDAQRGRRRRAEREVAVENLDFAQAPDPAPEAHSLSPRLAQALAQLPASQREAVELIQLEDSSVAEAAKRAGVSPGALKVRAHRGYRALRALLKSAADASS